MTEPAATDRHTGTEGGGGQRRNEKKANSSILSKKPEEWIRELKKSSCGENNDNNITTTALLVKELGILHKWWNYQRPVLVGAIRNAQEILQQRQQQIDILQNQIKRKEIRHNKNNTKKEEGSSTTIQDEQQQQQPNDNNNNSQRLLLVAAALDYFASQQHSYPLETASQNEQENSAAPKSTTAQLPNLSRWIHHQDKGQHEEEYPESQQQMVLLLEASLLRSFLLEKMKQQKDKDKNSDNILIHSKRFIGIRDSYHSNDSIPKDEILLSWLDSLDGMLLSDSRLAGGSPVRMAMGNILNTPAAPNKLPTIDSDFLESQKHYVVESQVKLSALEQELDQKEQKMALLQTSLAETIASQLSVPVEQIRVVKPESRLA